MRNLFIEATKATPEINFNVDKNYLLIKGESYPENYFKFYEPIFDWLENYTRHIKNEEVLLEIKITYLNTSSTKAIMSILDILEEAYFEGKKIRVNWYYDEEIELTYEIAEEYKEYLDLPFNLKKI